MCYTIFMHCPICPAQDTRVLDSRLSPDRLTIRRRRECSVCGFRFTTLEEMVLLDITVVKRDGRREPYSRDKLVAGLTKALQKRPFTADRFRNLVNRVEREIQKLRGNEITSPDIGEIVMKQLERFDKVAFIRFASVYRSFADVRTFEKELKRLTKKRKKSV